jgi:hypothetical protein
MRTNADATSMRFGKTLQRQMMFSVSVFPVSAALDFRAGMRKPICGMDNARQAIAIAGIQVYGQVCRLLRAGSVLATV